jgi:hypothetical protein
VAGGDLIYEILKVADDRRGDYVKKICADGKVVMVVDREHIARCRLEIKARKLNAARMTTKK